MRTVTAIVLGVLALGVTGTAAAGAPAFENGPLVARKMEAHYNGAAYKAKLAKADSYMTRRVLCAHDGYAQVECTGRFTVKGYAIRANWRLTKRSAQRAKLTWTLTGRGASDYESEIVTPRAYGLTRF